MDWKIRSPRQFAPLGNLSVLGVQIVSGGVFSNTSLLSAVYYHILHRRKKALVSQTIKIIGLQAIRPRISAVVLNERLFLCMSADNEEAI